MVLMPAVPDSPPEPLYQGRKAALVLDVIVVGCGLGGLAAAYCLAQAGHRVTVLESAKQLSEVGAGIQVTPNSSRLLIRWGLGPALRAVASAPRAITFRRWSTGERVGRTDWTSMEHMYGSPYFHVHRADLHKMLHDLARPHIDLQLNTTVVELVRTCPPALKTADGRILQADLVIGADGVKSLLRGTIIGKPDAPAPTGDAAYRALVPAHRLLEDPDLAPLVQSPEMTSWMGPGRHVMAYCVRAQEEFNIVLIHPDDGSIESWTAMGSPDKMRADFAGWEPRVTKLLSLVPSTLKWKLCARSPLDKWIHPDGRVVLLGDACHPMLPYRAQGAAMAVEDAAVLGSLLSRITDIAQLPAFLRAYQDLRLPRTANTQGSSQLNRHIFHLPDGEAQRKRDAAMRRVCQTAGEVFLPVLVPTGGGGSETFSVDHHLTHEVAQHVNGHATGGDEAKAELLAMAVESGAEQARGSPAEQTNGHHSEEEWSDTPTSPGADETAGNPNQWADISKSRVQFGYDADEAAERWWAEAGEQLIGAVGG